MRPIDLDAVALRDAQGRRPRGFTPSLPHSVHFDVRLKPHPLDGLMPELQELPETAIESRNWTTPQSVQLPLPVNSHGDGTGAPLPQVLVVRFEKDSAIVTSLAMGVSQTSTTCNNICRTQIPVV